MRKIITTFLILISLCFMLPAQAGHPKSFQEAKRNARIIFGNMRKTFYCGCRFDKELHIDIDSCGYKPRKNKNRSSRVEWEHIVPAENFGKSMESNCWIKPICKKKNGKTYKGRECCLNKDKLFQKMHNDLHNLVPAVGEVNGDRSNYRFSTLDKSEYNYGKCNFKISFKNRKVEPADSIKGTVARAYLYFNKNYKMKLSKQQRQLFDGWNHKFPPPQWEIDWDNEIFKVQGNHNTFISEWRS